MEIWEPKSSSPLIPPLSLYSFYKLLLCASLSKHECVVGLGHVRSGVMPPAEV